MRRFLRQLWIVVAFLVGAVGLSWLYYMPDASERGAWRAQTGGAILTFSRTRAVLYSETSSSCVEQLVFPAHMKIVEWAEGATIQADGDTLVLSVDGGLDPTPFVRIDALPDNCTKPNPNAPPREVFDALWTAMDEHYAFFDLHGVNWDERRDMYPDGATITSDDLFTLLSETLDGMDDGHLQLGTGSRFYSPSIGPEWLEAVSGENRRDRLWQVARDTIGTDLIELDLTAIEYVLLPDGVGYVLIRGIIMNTPFGAREEPAMAAAFAEVAEALGEANSIIIDVRYNPGGSDGVALGIASHFTAEPVDVFTKTTRDGDGQTDPFTVTLNPFDDTPLTQPVLLLTSQMTGSAAEILTLSMRDLPQVTVMGEATGGGLSDVSGFTLPNGWELGLSHQTYLTMDGELYEAIGIPPDIPLEIDGTALEAGQDPVLDAALEYVRNP